MLISRYSWHYRFNEWFTYNISGGKVEKSSLCPYFWATVSRLVVMAVFAASVITVVGMIGLGVALLGIATFTGNFAPLIILVSVIAVIAFILFLSVRKEENGYIFLNPERSDDSLVVNFAKAKKNKVCPMIQYIDK
jgi:hypothetical protein